MNLNSLKSRRADLKAAAEKLVNAAIESGKDLQGAKLQEYEKYVADMKDTDSLIARYNSIVEPGSPDLGAAFGLDGRPVLRDSNNGNGQPAMGKDGDGRKVPIFAKGQSVAAYMRQQPGAADISPEVTIDGIVRAMALGGGSREIRAALAEGTDSAGGYTVPSILLGEFIDALRARSVVFQAGARMVGLESNKTSIATIAGDPTAAWRAENADVTVSDMTFGVVSFAPKSLAVIVTASDEVLEDSINIKEAILHSLSASVGGELDRVALLGSGVAPQPKGVSLVSGVGSYSMGDNGAALTSFDPFIEALAILETANAQAPTACIVAPRTNKAMNLLKQATTNAPLPKPSAIANLPFLVTSKLPINESHGSSNASSRAVMGYWPELLVGVRHNLRIQVLTEKYRDKLQIGILADLRADIAVAHAASFCNIVGIL